MADADAGPTAGLTSGDPKIFVLSRELAEVHLLLDNLSADPEKSLAGLKDDALKANLDEDWVDKVCRVNWPPADQAAQAALLIRAKDFLNQQTRPATGATIAFTLLVTQTGQSRRRPGWLRIWKGWIGRNTLPMGVRKAMEKAQQSARPETDERIPSRTSLAKLAYPGLASKARSFRQAIFWMSVLLFGGLILTCSLSWYAAYGNATLTQLASVQTAYETAQKRVSDAEAPSSKDDHSANPATSAAAGGTSAAPASASAAESGDDRPGLVGGGSASPYVIHLCNRARLIPPPKDQKDQKDQKEQKTVAAALSVPRYDDVAEMQACGARNRALADVDSVEVRLHRWLHPFAADAPRRAATVGSVPTAVPLVEDAETSIDYGSDASSVATILSTAVLPFFYGLLGAGAAIIRSLSGKMKCSLLAPRDLTLSLQRLALGAVVGTCIGLFVTSPTGGASANPGLLGPVGLSGSALSFVAGYSVDAVFKALEGLINRIFSPADAPASGAHS